MPVLTNDRKGVKNPGSNKKAEAGRGVTDRP